MPGELFAQTLTPQVRRARSRWTLVGSLCAHTALIVAIVVVPIVSGAALPRIGDQLDVFVIAKTMPIPQPPAPPAAAAQPVPNDIKVDAAPLVAPDRFAPEPIVLPTGSDAGVPGALAPVSGSGVPHSVLAASSALTLGPPPAPTDPIRVGGDVKVPTRIAYAPPAYPPIAIQARVDGTVVLEATIDEHGVVKDLRVVRSIPLLDRAAIEAVSKWRYTPTRLNGSPVAVLMTVQVTFTLR
jgi:protein TonB